MNVLRMCVGLIVLLACVLSQAKGINFREDSWSAVKNKAKAEDKLIFVDIYTVWCGPCKSMDRYVFSDQGVGDFYNSNFISFKMNAEEKEGVVFSGKYGISSYPALLFVDGYGNQINKKVGALDKDDFVRLGRKALESKKKFAAISSAYNGGNRDPKFILKYLAFLKERGLPTDEVALWYLAMIGENHWASSENLNVIRQYIRNPYSTAIEFLSKNKETIDNPEKKNLIYQTLFGVHIDYIKTVIAKESDDGGSDRLLSHLESSFYPAESDYLKFVMKTGIFKKNKDWPNYTREVTAYVDKYHLKNANVLGLNNCAYLFYKNEVTDKNALKNALKWVDLALEMNKVEVNHHYILDTKASLLYKIGRNQEALEVAGDAVKSAKKTGADPVATLKLIEKIKAN